MKKFILHSILTMFILSVFIGCDPNVAKKVLEGDKAAPIITITGDNPASVIPNSTYTDAGATATDDVDGVVTATETSNNVNTAIIGAYAVEYRGCCWQHSNSNQSR